MVVQFLFLLDVAAAPMQSVGWVTIVILLAVILLLSVAFAGGLVFLLIWLKRRKSNV
ncbi:MAG: hypothetical protein AABN95_24955 [Acidobacteriota bacterium]